MIASARGGACATIASLLGAVVVCATLLGAATPPPHPDSLASHVLVIGEQGLLIRTRAQALSFLEVLPFLDEDGDGLVSAAEVELHSAALFQYVAANLRVGTGSTRDLEAEQWHTLTGLAARLAELGDLGTGNPGDAAGMIDLELEVRAVSANDVLLESSLFHFTSPDHTDLVRVEWPDGSVRHLTLSAETPRARSDPSGRGTLGAFFTLGLDHILSGWDHLTFVVLLLLASRSARSLAGVVTAFTVAHSITLGCVATGFFDLGPHGPLVEAGIALSIVYVGIQIAVRKELTRGPWIEAAVLGLVHGLGFAGFLADSLVGEEALLRALFGFNLGVEAGQLLVVAVLATLLRVFVRAPQGALAPRGLRLVGGVLGAGLALYWFFERI